MKKLEEVKKNRVLLFNGYRVSVWEGEKSYGDDGGDGWATV